MKNRKIYLAISLIALLMLSLTACAEISAEAAGASGQNTNSGYSRAGKDTSYTASNTSNQPDTSNSSQVALKYRGKVDAVTVNTLTLNGQTFSVATTQDLTTLFTPGSTFEIQFRQNRDGTISIDQFMAADGSVGYDVEFKGLVDAVTADTITLNGEPFTVTTTEDLAALFTPGEVYEIKYLLNADGTITIVAFHSEGEDDGLNDYDVEFKGMVETVTADTITLNGETLTVATTDDLTTLFTAGEFYEIKYLFNADGTITIIDFHFEDSMDDMSDDSSDDDWDDSSGDDSNQNNDDHDSSNDNNNHNNNNDDSNHNNSNDD